MANKNHPVSESVGAAGGAVTGMAVGAAVGGPAGAVVGGAVGAVAGGVAGHGVAAAFDPVTEEAYWRENYASRPYVRRGAPYSDYADAYRFGGEWAANSRRRWDEAERDLENAWKSTKSNTKLAWNDAKYAIRDGWHRVEEKLPGDADDDGR